MWVYEMSSLRFLAVNEAAVALYGYSKAEFLAMTVADIRPLEDVDKFRQHLAGSVESLHKDGPWRHLKKNGEILLVNVASHAIQFEGRPARFILIEDITGQTQAEASVRRSETRFRQLADSLPHIVWRARADGVIEYVNRRWSEVTDLELPVSVEHAWQTLLQPQAFAKVWEDWRAAVENERAYEGEWRLWHRGLGHWEWFLCRAVPVRDELDGYLTWFGTFTGINQHKETEAALRKANSDLNQFAYLASHDLQDPLRSMVVFSQLLRERQLAGADEETRTYLDYIAEGARRLLKMIEGLGQYISVAQASGEGELGVVNTETVFSTVLTNLSASIQAANATITKSELPEIRINPVHFERLLQNLISNAIKYTKPGESPQIHVAASQEDDSWLFSVSDHGIGIDPQYKDYVFQMFKRLDRELPGTGMGLAICQKIVERYGGRIWVESRQREGANFLFSIPADPQES
jgi:PAS domain S-box-containing protein